MKKKNLKETLDRLLTRPERLVLILTALFTVIALAVSLRPAGELVLQPGTRAETTLRSLPEAETVSPALVDLNTADQAALETLPGIGPVLAERIIDYRAEHGPFQDAAQLMLVDGIGDKLFSRLAALVTVSGEKEETP